MAASRRPPASLRGVRPDRPPSARGGHRRYLQSASPGHSIPSVPTSPATSSSAPPNSRGASRMLSPPPTAATPICHPGHTSMLHLCTHLRRTVVLRASHPGHIGDGLENLAARELIRANGGGVATSGDHLDDSMRDHLLQELRCVGCRRAHVRAAQREGRVCE